MGGARLGLTLVAAALLLGVTGPARSAPDLEVSLAGAPVEGSAAVWFNGTVDGARSCPGAACFDQPLRLVVPPGYWDAARGGIELTIRQLGAAPQDVIGARVELLGPDGTLVATSRNAWADEVALARGMTSGDYVLRVNATRAATTTFTGLVQREVRAREPAVDLLPDLRVLPIGSISTVWQASKLPLSCRPYEVASSPLQTRCLRFHTSIANFGPGRLELVVPREEALRGLSCTTSACPDELGHLDFAQVVERSDGARVAHPAGRAVYHVGHDHYHYARFVENALYAYDEATHARGALVVEGRKEGFCPADSGLVALGLPDTEEPAESTCKVTDGADIVLRIDSNYYDTYTANIDDQEIDITSVPPGSYELVTTVDPDATILQASHANDAASACLRIEPHGAARQVPC